MRRRYASRAVRSRRSADGPSRGGRRAPGSLPSASAMSSATWNSRPGERRRHREVSKALRLLEADRLPAVRRAPEVFAIAPEHVGASDLRRPNAFERVGPRREPKQTEDVDAFAHSFENPGRSIDVAGTSPLEEHGRGFPQRDEAHDFVPRLRVAISGQLQVLERAVEVALRCRIQPHRQPRRSEVQHDAGHCDVRIRVGIQTLRQQRGGGRVATTRAGTASIHNDTLSAGFSRRTAKSPAARRSSTARHSGTRSASAYINARPAESPGIHGYCSEYVTSIGSSSSKRPCIQRSTPSCAPYTKSAGPLSNCSHSRRDSSANRSACARSPRINARPKRHDITCQR